MGIDVARKEWASDLFYLASLFLFSHLHIILNSLFQFGRPVTLEAGGVLQHAVPYI